MDGAPSGSQVRVLGWDAEDRVSMLVQDGDGLALQSVLVPRLDQPTQTRTLVTIEAGVPLTEVSLATNLLSRPTRDFPAPDWPTDWSLVATWAAGGVLALGGVLLLVRARRRSTLR